MARMTRESLQLKIQKAEEKVVRTGNTYNAACEELTNLRNKMEAIDNEVLVEAFMKSNITLEEAIAMMSKYQVGIEMPADKVAKVKSYLDALTGEYQGKLLVNDNTK